MYVLLLVSLALLFFAALPIFAHSSSWGYGPAAIVGTLLALLLLLPLLVRKTVRRRG